MTITIILSSICYDQLPHIDFYAACDFQIDYYFSTSNDYYYNNSQANNNYYDEYGKHDRNQLLVHQCYPPAW